MSTGITCDEAKIILLDNAVNNVPWTGAQVLLSEANITPDRTTVLSDLTANEVSVTGYARQNVVFSGTPSLAGGIATDQADTVTFLNTSGGDSGTIYCWGIVDGGGTFLIEAGRWDVPFVLVGTTGSYSTTPSTRLRGE